MATARANSKQIRCDFKVKGERRTTTVDVEPTKANLKAQKIRADEAEEQLKQGRPWELVRAWLRDEKPEGEPTTFSQTVGFYAQLLLDQNEVADGTLTQYQNIYNRHWSKFDHFPINELKKVEIKRQIALIDGEVKYKKNILSVLSQIFEQAIDDDDCEIGHNPCANWKWPKQQKSKIDPYSTDEKIALLDALMEIDESAHRIFAFAFATGLRTGEICGLKWDCIDFDEEPFPTMHIHRSMSAGVLGPVKTRQERIVSLSDQCAELLRFNPSRFKAEFVFTRPMKDNATHEFKGEYGYMQDGDWMNERFLLAHQMAGVRKRSGRYAWRRTYISESLMAGVNEFWLCKQSGHDIATMRRHYAEWIQENKEADLRNMAILKAKNEEQSEKGRTKGAQSDDPKS